MLILKTISLITTPLIGFLMIGPAKRYVANTIIDIVKDKQKEDISLLISLIENSSKNVSVSHREIVQRTETVQQCISNIINFSASVIKVP